MVLPKAGLTQYDWADRSKSAFVMLLSSNAKNPHFGNTRTLPVMVQKHAPTDKKTKLILPSTT